MSMRANLVLDYEPSVNILSYALLDRLNQTILKQVRADLSAIDLK